jgi:hypothetical protein
MVHRSNMRGEINTLDLPLLLRLTRLEQIFLSVILILAIVSGLFLRKTIFNYLCSPDMKTGPINVFLMMEQINSLALLTQMIFVIVTLNVKTPVSIFTGI